MRVFFSLNAETDRRHGAYRDGIEALARSLGFTPVYSDEPIEGERLDWISEKLSECDFAFFDVSGVNVDALVSFGIGHEREAQCFALRDPDIAPTTPSSTVCPVRDFFGPDDFQRKARDIITEVQGALTVQQRQLIERIKSKVKALGVAPMREIAHELGRHPAQIRWLVYNLVANRELVKENDRRWAKYKLPE